MSSQDKYLAEAQRHMSVFEANLEAESLRVAALTLEDVQPSAEPDPKQRARIRSEGLHAWLKVLGLMDRHLDPRMDPNDVPQLLVDPPPNPQGPPHEPGVSPDRITDPQVRQAYERAIAANNAKANRYRLQSNLARLNERASSRAERFITENYTQSAADQTELRNAIDVKIASPQRKSRLMKLLSPPAP